MNDKNNETNFNLDPNNEDPKEKMRRKVKKAANIALCAVLAGGVTVGAYEAAGNLTGWNSRVEASTKNTQTTLKTAGETKVEDGTEDTEEKTLLQTAEETEEDTDDSEDADDAEEEDTEDKGTTNKGSLDVSDIAAEGMKSVVSITTVSVQEVQNYLGYFGYGDGSSYTTQQEVEGAGSGIIVGQNDTELLIATNYHVIEDANEVSITTIDGEVYEASVKGYDEDKDLAVVSVKLEDISDDTMEQIAVATIGSSDDLKVGEQVVAIGNALGYGQSVTTGIVSAKNRQLDDNGDLESEDADGVNLIQTDAAINPGNSGGALLNMDGEVVGINSAKLASTTIEGMGYAIAISDVSDILENLMNETAREKVEDHGVLGITGKTVSDEAAADYGVPEGVLVYSVSEGSGAEAAGIKEKSIITEFDGKRVRSIESLVGLLEYYAPGEEVEVTIEVADGEGYTEQTVTVTLGEQEETNETEESTDGTTDETIEDLQPSEEPEGSTDDILGEDTEEDSEEDNGGFNWGDFSDFFSSLY